MLERRRIAALQEDHAPPRAIGECRIGVELLARCLVKIVERAEAELARRGVGSHVREVLDEHPERRAPVSHVVLANHAMPEEVEHARERVADDGAPDVADVHLLGHVRPRVVDDDDLPLLEAPDARALAGGHVRERALEERATEHEVHEAGRRDGDAPLGDEVGNVERAGDGLGDLERRLLERLGEA